VLRTSREAGTDPMFHLLPQLVVPVCSSRTSHSSRCRRNGCCATRRGALPPTSPSCRNFCQHPAAKTRRSYSVLKGDWPPLNLNATPTRISLIGLLFPVSAESAGTLANAEVARSVYRYSMRPKTSWVKA
jgi:hypothetical protein